MPICKSYKLGFDPGSESKRAWPAGFNDPQTEATPKNQLDSTLFLIAVAATTALSWKWEERAEGNNHRTKRQGGKYIIWDNQWTFWDPNRKSFDKIQGDRRDLVSDGKSAK